MKTLSILGATGSIGMQALSVADSFPDKIKIVSLSAHSNADKLFELVRKYRPKAAALTQGEADIPEDLHFCEWFFGKDALKQMTENVPSDDVLVSVVGMSALEAVLSAIKTKKRVLLANKETLVAGGDIIMPLCNVFGENANLLPVDSEHSAIHQCLSGAGGSSKFKSIVLTASGGPFRTYTKQQMQRVTLKDALKHPTWNMGAKITIDSATMFNKALEVIEASYLFSAPGEKIKVLIHPQSIVHSMVEYENNSVLAQMGVPDMKTPISYAMFYPVYMKAVSERLDLSSIGYLSFERPDFDKFKALKLAFYALKTGGSAPCVLNAANEAAVYAFLDKRISFASIYDTVENVLNLSLPKANTVEEILAADSWARLQAEQYISRIS